MRLWVIAVAVACVTGGAPVSVAAARPAPPCLELAFSPAFATDRTVFCAYDVPEDGAYVARSTDGGRTWGSGRLVHYAADAVAGTSVMVSPWFARDGRVLVTTRAGLFESTDRGTTYHQIDADWSTQSPPIASRITPFHDSFDAVDDTGGSSGAFVFSTGSGAARVYDPDLGARAVAGVALRPVTRFLVPPDYVDRRQAVALASAPVGVYSYQKPVTPSGLAAYRCVGDFVCGDPITYFGDVVHADSAPLAQPGSLALFTRDSTASSTSAPVHAWRTRDHGQTWQPWPSASRLVAPRPATFVRTAVTASPDAPKRLFLHVTWASSGKDGSSSADDTWGFRLYRSDDDGATWRQAGGALPWNTGSWSAPVTLSAQPGGRLYATGLHRSGKRVDYQGVFCSRDGGGSWRRGGC
jgi:hypothetical protein